MSLPLTRSRRRRRALGEAPGSLDVELVLVLWAEVELMVEVIAEVTAEVILEDTTVVLEDTTVVLVLVVEAMSPIWM
jgi:hypothetical protein